MKTFLFLAVLFCNWNVAIARPAKIDTTRAVIHHTATPMNTSVESIRRYHIEERGWEDIGYHFLISWKGEIFPGRPLNKLGAHARSRNDRVGIALIGEDDFTMAHIVSLLELLEALGVKTIEAHHEKCPGIPLEDLFKAILKVWDSPIPEIVAFSDAK